MKFTSLTQRFVLWFLLISLLPVVLIGYSLLHTFELELRQTASRQISFIADKKVDQIDAYLSELIRVALIKTQGNTTRRAMEEFASVFAQDGVKSAAYRRLDAGYRDYFQRFLSTGGYYDLFLISTDGTVVYTQKHEADFATNLFNGPYRNGGLANVTRNALKTLESGISEFEIYAPSGNAIAAFVAVPIMHQGKVAGVLALQIDNARVYQVMLDITGLGESGETVVARSEGEHSALAVVPLKSIPDAAMKYRIRLDNQRGAIPMAHALNGERGSGFVSDYLGHPVVAAWRYMPRMKWGIVSNMDSAEALAPYYRVRSFALVSLVLALIAAIFGAILLGRRVAVPLQNLNNSAQEIAAGKLDQRVPGGGQDELGQLADSFNTMAARLQSSYANLEGQVEQRTAELTRSLANLRIKDAAIASSINAIAITDLDGKITYVNQAFVDMWRLQGPEEAVGRLPGEFLERPGEAQVVMEALYQQGQWQGELHACLHDGARAIMQLSAHMVADDTGKPVCMMGSFVDVTARKQAELATMAAKNQLEATIDAIPDLLFELGLDGTYHFVHAQNPELLAAPVEKLLGKKVFDVLSPEAADVVMQALQAAQEHGRSHGKQFELSLLEGKSWFELSVSRKNTAPGQEPRFIVLSRDITARKQMEQALQQERDFASSLVNTAPVIVLLLDTRGAIEYINPYFEQLGGYPLDEVKDKDWFSTFLPARDQDKIRALFQQSLHGAPTHDNINTILTRSGAELDIEWYEQVIRDAQGKAISVLAAGQDVTARKAMELTLSASAARLNEAQRIAHVGSWELDLLSGELAWSDEIFRLFEIDKHHFGATYEAFLDAIHPDDRDAVNQAYTHSLEARTPYEITHRLLMGDGRIKWVQERCETFFDAEGKPLRSTGTVQDISERKKVEQALEQNELLFRTLTQVAPVGIFRADVSGACTYANEQYCMIAGCSSESVLGTGWTAGIHPDDRPLVCQKWTEAVQAQKNFELEFRVQRPDGLVTWVVGQSRAESDAQGKVVGYVGTVIDINERKLAEEKLRVAAVTFEMHEAIMITDANARIIRVNQAFQDITGYSAEEVLGKNPRILSSGRHNKEFYARLWQQLLNTGSWSGEIWDKRKSGQIYPKWATITAVKNSRGETSEYVAVFSDITARKQAEEEIRNLAFYDSLTRLPNRRLLLDRFRQALTVSSRSNKFGAVLFLDMDRFKILNDTLGHDYGDLLLIEVGRRIQSCVREMDTVARLGGDEFVVLIEEVDKDAQEVSQKISLMAEKIRATLSLPYMLKEHECHSSPSIGVSLYCGSNEPVENLLKHADMAMYQAKDSGRNAVRFFDPMMQQAVESRAALEDDLRGAVAKNQFFLYYQIQVDNEHRPLGAEALIRWMHPQRGMLLPAQFIPVAEESTLILEVDHWVLETACRQLALWGQNLQTRHLSMAVNVSAHQFMKHDLVETVAATLRTHRVDPSRLKLELTESMVLENVAEVVTKMHALKALGVKLSLDDFGTGYSLLSCLKQLPFDQIKIDRSFVRDLMNTPNDAVLVQTIIDMGKNFRLNVIAEGVENQAQLAFLKDHGCMAYQGYLFSKPVPIEQFEKLLGDYL